MCGSVCVCVCERVKEFVVWFRIAPSLDTVTALHRRQAPCSYMQVTVVAPQSLASNDRKPRDRASQRGRLSACEERTEAGEKRRADEPSPLPRAAAAQAPRPARGRGGEAPGWDGGGEAGGGEASSLWTRKHLDDVFIAVMLIIFSVTRIPHDNGLGVLSECCC